MNLFSKFPSFDNLVKGSATSFKRFPVTLICTVLVTLALVIIINADQNAHPKWLERLALTCALGVPLFFVFITRPEIQECDKTARIIAHSFGTALLVIYYFTLPQNPSANFSNIIRFLLLMIAVHFAVSFLPYIGPKKLDGFWQYNKTLFLRFLNSALFSAVMYIGLLLALVAAKELFGFKIPDKRFFQLFIIIGILFNTWVFLSGIPQNLKGLGETSQYPNGLRIFAQYILLPLIGIYFVILYAYELKIIINWNWPKGWVSQLVLWYSVVGILSLLLLWPLRNLTENRWIKTFTTWFFRALIPLVVMLFLAILERVGTYGITINRYLVLAMAVGLSIVVLYFVFGKAKDIRAIPIVICIIAILSALGPWSAFAVSRHSQTGRLEKYLVKNSLLTNGKLIPSQAEIPLEDRMEMSEIISYLVEWHGVESFEPWIADSTMKSIVSTPRKYDIPDSVAHHMGFQYVAGRHYVPGEGEYFSMEKSDTLGVDISGYDQMFHYSRFGDEKSDTKSLFYFGNDTISVWQASLTPALKIMVGPDSVIGEIPFSDSIKAMLPSRDRGHLDNDRWNYDVTIGKYDARFDIRRLTARVFPDSIKVSYVNAYMLLREKK